jgi:hypothetical protein
VISVREAAEDNDAGDIIVQTAAWVSYGVYYVSYHANENLPGDPLLVTEILGLTGDVLINVMQGSEPNDHQYYGEIVPNYVEDLLNWDSPEVWLPGWNHDDVWDIDVHVPGVDFLDGEPDVPDWWSWGW